MIHTVKGSSIVNETEVDVFFLEFPCFLYDPANGNWITGSSAFSKYSWDFCKFMEAAAASAKSLQ